MLLLLLACSGAPSDAPDAQPEPAAPAEAATARPNVLVITLDTLRADALQIYGNTAAKTPVLNQLAAESARFSRAFTVTPLTIPAHSSLFTGLYPPRHGVRDNGDHFLADEAVTMAERFQAAGYATMASVGAEVTSHHWGFGQGFDAFYDDMGGAADQARSRWRVERPGDEVLRDAIQWLDANEDGPKPWFAWVHLFDAHHPYTSAPEELRAQFPDQPYLAEVAWLDVLVGNLLAALEKRGELEETWVVAMADHGEGLGTHGERLHGVLLYNPTVRIPLLIRPPGGTAEPAFVHFPVSTVDLLPTLLAATDQEIPAGLDGIDLTPWIAAADAQPPEPEGRGVYVESLYAFRHYGWAPQRALVTQDRKLIDSTTPELYDREDVFDANDLAPGAPQEVEGMRAEVRGMAAAMEPVEGASAAAEMSPERIAQLEALGYMAGSSGDAPAGELPEGDALLPDPVQRLPSLARIERAREHIQRGEFEEAEVALREILAEDPGLGEPRLMMATVLKRLGRVEEALAAAIALEQESPSSITKIALAQLRMELGDFPEGARLLEEALAIDPYHGAAWTHLLHALFLSLDLESLADATDRARGAVPDLLSAQVMTAHLHLLRGEVAEAEPLLRAALERDARAPFARHGLGAIHRSRGEAADAEAAFLAELEDSPWYLPARRQLVELYVEQERWAEQLEQLEAIVAQDPASPLVRRAIAQSLFNQGRYSESLGSIRSCQDLDPTDAQCALLEANALKKLGRDDEALAAFERAKALKAASP